MDVPLLTGEQASAWDRRAIEREGVPERVLMENAGRAAALILQRLAGCWVWWGRGTTGETPW
jgi:NAD(P)H-hydrate repair Nnr-like enzyme with NAD(P)H-hydrate epimerase domain